VTGSAELVAPTTVTRALDDASATLGAAGCETPRVDAELLLAHVLETDRAGLYADSRRALDVREERELASLLDRRARREPLAYVLGEWGFRRLTLSVDPRVLVPRPETEVVVERCLALLAGQDEPRVLDVGTGSGAIALAIADEHPAARVTGMDSSPEALAVARANAARAGLELELVLGDLYDGLPGRRGGAPWDLVVSNPPYVLPDEIGSLEAEVREWEPRAALVGVGATEAVAEHAAGVLRPGGALVLEVAAGSGEGVAGRLRALGYGDVLVTRDLAGRERVVEGIRA
jgi:release factor glutamine methyltransferase